MKGPECAIIHTCVGTYLCHGTVCCFIKCTDNIEDMLLKMTCFYISLVLKLSSILKGSIGNRSQYVCLRFGT